MLNNLGLALVKRFEELSVIDNLDYSMEYCKSAEEPSHGKASDGSGAGNREIGQMPVIHVALGELSFLVLRLQHT